MTRPYRKCARGSRSTINNEAMSCRVSPIRSRLPRAVEQTCRVTVTCHLYILTLKCYVPWYNRAALSRSSLPQPLIPDQASFNENFFPSAHPPTCSIPLTPSISSPTRRAICRTSPRSTWQTRAWLSQHECAQVQRHPDSGTGQIAPSLVLSPSLQHVQPGLFWHKPTGESLAIAPKKSHTACCVDNHNGVTGAELARRDPPEMETLWFPLQPLDPTDSCLSVGVASPLHGVGLRGWVTLGF